MVRPDWGMNQWGDCVVSCWIDAGLPPKTVQTFAGHSSLQATMDRYGHAFWSDRHASAMDVIASEIYEAVPPARPPATWDGRAI
jgi:hypothetical protein